MQYSGSTLAKTNVDRILANYLKSVRTLGRSIARLRGLRLLEALKRHPTGSGPYPGVTLFEAANRIMTDLVILYGVKWILERNVFPFNRYTVEFGNEDRNGFDIRASRNGKTLLGEAFNVAPSLYQTKKNAMLKKLRNPTASADFRVLMFNQDAVQADYVPNCRPKEFVVVVDVATGAVKILPGAARKPDVRQAGSVRVRSAG